MKRHESFFFPLVLIAAGALWLLVELQIIPAANLWALTHIWPYLLIMLGLGVILRSQLPSTGVLVSVLVVLGAVLAVYFAPQLGWTTGPEWNIGVDFRGDVPGSGRIKTETRAVQSVTGIHILYPAEVTVQQGAEESVRVEADDNLLPQLSTAARNGILVIENSEREWSKRVDPSQTVKITITVRDLREVEFSSAGTLLVEGLETDELQIELSGAGNVILSDLTVRRLDCELTGAGGLTASGEAVEFDLEIDGFGSFNGMNLLAQEADVIINGAGDVDLRVKDQLKAVINGAGSVRYYGSPQVDQQVNGAGSVRQVEK
ncbi:MAG: DUF2807 domain-containing protein [Chloroflexi bacterium]|nr:DUF2807 domain-containing protein [Chloroflexota bacterium]